MFDRIAATQLASLLLLFALGLLVLERSLRGRARFVQSQRRGLGVHARAADGLVGGGRRGRMPRGAGGRRSSLPVAALLLWARDATAGGTAAVPGFGAALANTVLLASAAAVVTGRSALVLVLRRALAAGARSCGWPTRLAAMGYALPGSVIAVGVLHPAGPARPRAGGARASGSSGTPSVSSSPARSSASSSPTRCASWP